MLGPFHIQPQLNFLELQDECSSEAGTNGLKPKLGKCEDLLSFDCFVKELQEGVFQEGC